jgi:regulator of sirC expression with transglutaminase-like and TPR domain
MPLDGISFPGHFLVRLPVGDSVLVMDPFNRGRPLDVEELRQRAKPHLGGEMPDDEALYRILHPATHRAMLMRMLRNLHGVYAEREDWERAVRSADRLLKLAPDNAEALRDRGLGYLKLGYRHGARQDLDRYLQRYPDAPDAGPLRERLVELSASAVRPS